MARINYFHNFLLRATLGAAAVAGCSTSPAEEKDVYGAQVGIVNHTADFIYSVSVGNGGGGPSYPFHAGVANMCCVTLPDRWHPNLEVWVHWDVPVGLEHRIKKKLVKVEKYDEAGSLYVHIFPHDEVRIVVSNWFGSNMNHPIAPPVPGEKLIKLYR